MATATATKLDVRDLRLLLALWELSQAKSAEKTEREIIDAAKKSKDTVGKYKEALNNLVKAGHVTESDNAYALTSQGEAAIRETLKTQPKLLVSDASPKATVVGRRDHERLLAWMQQELINAETQLAVAATVSTVASNGATPEPIASYEEFKDVALDTYDKLNRDYNYDDLVPIYRIRREIGDRVSRAEFSDWLLEMQAEDILLLLESGVEDGASDKLQDSVKTAFGELRCYAQKMAA
jgi:hypothetical protein